MYVIYVQLKVQKILYCILAATPLRSLGAHVGEEVKFDHVYLILKFWGMGVIFFVGVLILGGWRYPLRK